MANKMKGSIANQLLHIIDLMPTIIEITKAEYPKTFNGNSIHGLEGESFASLIKGKTSWQRKKPIFWEHEKKVVCGREIGRLQKFITTIGSYSI